MKLRGLRLRPGMMIGISLAMLASCAGRSPATAVESYARAVYARNYGSAYAYLSANDQAALSQDDYVAQYDVFKGAQLQVAQHLATFIEFQNPHLVEAGDTATMTVHVRAPDGNAPAVAAILDQAALPGANAIALEAKVDGLRDAGQLPFVEGDQIFELQRNRGRWGVALRLGEAALVTFTADVKAGLPWRFEPVQASARLLPGDRVRAQFRVKNLSDATVTGKANEDTLPESLAGHLYFYQCFCMLQLTLAPGEEQTLTVVLGLTEALPAGQNELEVHYDFYPIEAFPWSPASHGD